MMESSDNIKSFFKSLFIPDYDELALYSISYICLLLFLINNPPNQWDLSFADIQIQEFATVIIFLVFIIGMLLSLYHPFSSRKKTYIEKKFMLIFAVFICGFSGIWGATYMLINSPGWLIVFPVWNLISSYLILTSLDNGEVTEDRICDENVEITEVMLSTVILSIVFFICYLGYKLNWAATFSICIAWATTFNGAANSVFIRE